MGRPLKFRPPCKSQAEALAWVLSGEPRPKRGRNEFEREAFAQKVGRPRKTESSPVRQAAMLAVHLHRADGLSRRAAAKTAASAHHVSADAVRKDARVLDDGPKVRVKRTYKVMGVQVTQEADLPFLAETYAVQK